MASIRRMLRMMAGELKDPAQRQAERVARQEKRVLTQVRSFMALGEKIERRQKGDSALPPMPLDFVEIERRRRDGTNVRRPRENDGEGQDGST